MERRDLVGGGLAAGLTALMAGGDAEAAAQGDSSGAAASEIRELRRMLEENYDRPWVRLAPIREQQRQWLRTHHKYPEFIEIGTNFWDALYDWHVRFQQPIGMTRSPDGRYMMSFMFTTFILRPDAPADYLGPPYEDDPRRGNP